MGQPIHDVEARFTTEASARTQPPAGVKWFWAAIVLFSAGFLAYRAAGPGPAMGAGSGAASAEFASGDRPTLALFTADWCGPCRKFKSDVLADPQVQQTLESSYEFVKVDLTESDGPGAADAQEHNVQGIPTLVIFDREGREVSRRVGGISKGEFLRWINAAQAQAQ